METYRGQKRRPEKLDITVPILALWLALSSIGVAQSTVAVGPTREPQTSPAQGSEAKPANTEASKQIVTPKSNPTPPDMKMSPFTQQAGSVKDSNVQTPVGSEKPTVTIQKPSAPSADTSTAPPPGTTGKVQTDKLAAPVSEQPENGSKSEKSSSAEDNKDVMLNLENADIYQVLRIVGNELKINYVVDPAVKGTVTINTSGAVSRADLFTLLQLLLQINGAVIVKTDTYFSVVPSQGAKQLPLPFRVAKGPDTLLEQEGLALLVVPMKYISANEMGKILNPFISPGGQIIIQEDGNLLLIVESGPKLKQLREIITLFDSEVLGRQRVKLFPVTNNLAKSLVGDLQSVFSGYGLGKSAIRFVPLDRLNSILAISSVPEVFIDIAEWIQRLDKPMQDPGIRNFVYKVQNAKASDLRDLLVQLYGGQIIQNQTLKPEVAPPAVTAPLKQEGLMTAVTQPVSAKLDSAPGTTVIQGEVKIMSDEKNNFIIVQGTQRDFDGIVRTLRDLDVLPRQVLIDAKIYEVTLTGDLSLGITAYLDRTSNLPKPVGNSASFNGQQLALAGYAVLNKTFALQAFLTASENKSRIRALAAPSILVTDNTSARIQVGEEVPVPIGSSLLPVQSGNNSLFAQTIQFRDTGVILTVTPRINASGLVSLEIAQEVSNAVPNTTSGIVAPVITKSSFQTSVVVNDGQALALGGIITTTQTLTKNRIPLLGDIPGIGLLFGSTTNSSSRKEIVLMLTPHVIQTSDQQESITQEFLKTMREVRNAMSKMN